MTLDSLGLSFVDRELHFHVNDVDLTAEAEAMGMRPFELLLPVNRLAATEEPHSVYLARCRCGSDICGLMTVDISRDGDLVHWDWGKRAPLMDRRATFSVAQYDAEIARATADESWETPGYTAERRVRTDADHAHLARFDLGFDYITAWQRGGETFHVCLIGGGYQVMLNFPWQGREPAELAAAVCATLALPPQQWDAEYFPNHWELHETPPAYAGPTWRNARPPE